MVGATPTACWRRAISRWAGIFRFLHPESREDALARTERKSGNGYTGFVTQFAPDVTLEQDLQRRDLTINAIAQAADGTLIDPIMASRICSSAPCVTCRQPLMKIRCACCAWRVLLPVSPISISAWHLKPGADARDGAQR